MKQASIVHEYGPFPDIEAVHGVSHDGKNVWFASGDKLNVLDPESGKITRSIPVAADAGTAFDGRYLFQIAGASIQKIDPDTGAVLRTIESNRFVTGVTWLNGELWHATWEGDESDLRRIDADTGEVKEKLAMPAGTGISGLESDGRDRFFCGSGMAGKVRVVRTK